MKRNNFFVVFGLGGLAILLGLCFWQMQRLSWKQAILQEIETRIAFDPVPLPEMPDPVKNKYLSVQAQGRMGPESLRVLVSQKHIGAGYRLISPFETNDGRRVLVDRGFIGVHVPQPEHNPTEQKIIGNLHWPNEIDSFTPEADIEKNVWFARDVTHMAEVLQSEPILIVLRKAAQSDAPVSPLPVDTRSIPNNHLQYAITWFLLALVWGGMTGYFMLHRTHKP